MKNKFARVEVAGKASWAVMQSDQWHLLPASVDAHQLQPIIDVIEGRQSLGATRAIDAAQVKWLQPVPTPGKVVCLGLNYAAHAAEGGNAAPEYPAFFMRGASSLIAHHEPLIRPRVSDKLDYEAELAVVIGKRARHLTMDNALQAVLGYSCFNDGTLRDYQRRASQWTIGKNFDGTGAFGPWLVPAANLPAGARVLDACAAPGGKTAHLLELADLDVTALDADPERLARVNDTLQRLGLKARTVAADASQPQSWWDGQAFDAILLDAPCSASGIVRRHPDVRWLRRETDIAALARTQDAILNALWPLLKPGGHLLYCTCSVFKMEGQDRIDAFLQRTPDAQAHPAPGHLLPVVEYLDPAGRDRGDGFFYALLSKSPLGS